MSSLAIEYTTTGSNYCRTVSSSRILLQEELMLYYGLQNKSHMQCLIFPSGLSAISSIVNVLAMPNEADTKSVFLLANELFSVTPNICKYQKKYNKNIFIETVDVTNTDSVIEKFKLYANDLKLFFIESCSNPSGFMFDPSKIVELKKLSPNCIICIDNTWLSGHVYNPFKYGTDVVIESMSKYISNGKCIGGMAIGNNSLMNIVRRHVQINGLFVSADCCDIFLTGLKTIKTRIENSSKLALDVANYLTTIKEVNCVMYPKLPDHPSYPIAVKYCKFNPGCMWFHVETPIKKIQDILSILSNNKFLPLETSFGSSISKIDPYSKLKTIVKADKPILGVWIRLAIGSESSKEIVCNGIDQLIADLNN